MSLRKYGSLSFVLSGCILMFLLSACNTPLAPNATNQSLLMSISSQNAQAVSVTTACPAPGMGRAAVLPALTVGTHQTLVYTSNQYDSRGMPLSSALKRYDTVTKSTTNILTLTGKPIHDAQVSADGQWVLFETQIRLQTKLELMRIDGRYQQTLYCSNAAGIYEMQWSTNRKFIVFDLNNSSTESVELLNTTTGAVQAELTVPLNSQSNGLIVRTWLDYSRVYLTNTQQDQPPNIIYLLDTSKGPNQQLSDLITVFNGNFTDFDSSYDATKLFINACSCGLGGNSGPGTITVQPATGGQAQTLYSTANYAITSVRAVTATTLLFTIDNFSGIGQSDQSQNGLWKMQTNGTGLTRLTTDVPGQNSSLNTFSQFPWSNVSRDSTLYSIQVQGNMMASINVGFLSGGTPTTAASSNSSGTSLNIVGWTKM
ncbi:MAG: hypothetical protein NVSMB27_16640 [Ktedonobacteraceae bacterium]